VRFDGGMKRTAAACAGLLLIAGCGQAKEAPDYYEQMRDVPGLESSTDADLDELADMVCNFVDVVIEGGGTNEEALDAVYQSLLKDTGLSEADALLVSVSTIGMNCPIDISQ